MSISFVTGNSGKFRELQSLIPSLEQKNINLTEIQELDPRKIIETKLKEAFQHHEGKFIVEDTSLYLDCMQGLPGPLIKWFIQTIGAKGLAQITKSFQNNKATARTFIGFASSKTDVHFFEGSIEGTIVEPRGENGFGWDPIFQPNGAFKTFAEMTLEEKMKYSMRNIAANKLKDFLHI